MTLKEEIFKDIDNVFMNEDEFADKHEFDGEIITCIVDDDLLIENQKKSELFKGDKIIHVAKDSLKGMPIANSTFITFDREYYKVIDVSDNMGMLTITLEKNDGQ